MNVEGTVRELMQIPKENRQRFLRIMQRANNARQLSYQEFWQQVINEVARLEAADEQEQ